MKKGISQENKVAKEDFPTKMIDSPNDAREGLKEATKEKTKGIQFVHYYKQKRYSYCPTISDSFVKKIVPK